MRDQLDKIKILSQKVKQSSRAITIAVDGGINDVTAKECIGSGAEVLVSGSFIFQGGNYSDKINKLRSVVSP
jgi:ribulose-phosphate 3-epimerase